MTGGAGGRKIQYSTPAVKAARHLFAAGLMTLHEYDRTIKRMHKRMAKNQRLE